jgi:hypothetical protein
MAEQSSLSIEVVVAIAMGVPALLIAMLTLWIGYLTLRHSDDPRRRESGRDTFSMLPLMAYGMAGLAAPLLPARPQAARLRN